VTGDASRVHPNPADRFPLVGGISYRLGVRTVGEEHLWQADTSRVFMEIAANYGDPFRGETRKPFSSFDFGLQLNFKDKNTFGRMSTKGILYASKVAESERSQHLVAAYQHYDYSNTNAYEYGAQSVGASFLSRMQATEKFEMRTALHLNVILMGATKSDYSNISGRSYDYGPGLGFKFSGTFLVSGHPILTLAHDQSWIHSINGTAAEHILSGSRARVDLPLKRGLSLGVDYVLYLADRNYRDFPDVHKRIPELRTALSWNL